MDSNNNDRFCPPQTPRTRVMELVGSDDTRDVNRAARIDVNSQTNSLVPAGLSSEFYDSTLDIMATQRAVDTQILDQAHDQLTQGVQIIIEKGIAQNKETTNKMLEILKMKETARFPYPSLKDEKDGSKKIAMETSLEQCKLIQSSSNVVKTSLSPTRESTVKFLPPSPPGILKMSTDCSASLANKPNVKFSPLPFPGKANSLIATTVAFSMLDDAAVTANQSDTISPIPTKKTSEPPNTDEDSWETGAKERKTHRWENVAPKGTPPMWKEMTSKNSTNASTSS